MKSIEATEPRAESGAEDLSGALHEVSNALTVVLGWLEEVRSSLPPGPAREATEVAVTHARLGHIVARRAIGADAEQPTVARGAGAVAREAALGVSREAARRGVEIAVEPPADGEVVLRSSDVALQILINLLLNAIGFSQEGSKVRLGVRAEGESIRFGVTDSGPGVPADRIETLFTGPGSTRPGGAGIGLRYSGALAASVGGQLRLASTGPTGSCFELFWPGGEAQSGTLHRPQRRACLDGLRILALEDDEGVRSLVEFGLTARGAEVVAVGSPEEFGRILARGVFDVALLDLSPLADPTESIRELKARHHNLQIVVISGSATPDIDTSLVDAWVRKPFEVTELADALGQLNRAG